MDIDFLNNFSDQTQIIMIYDENTGGPNFEESEDDFDWRLKKRKFREISDKILLLPIKTTSGLKTLYSDDIQQIFETVVYRAVQNFKPEFIVFNVSLNFTKTNSSPFYLEPIHLGRIVQGLCRLCESRLIIYPFKIPTKYGKSQESEMDDIELYINQMKEEFLRYSKNFQRLVTFEKKNDYSAPKESLKIEISEGEIKHQIFQMEWRTRYILNKYGEDYDRKYILQGVVNCLEAISGLRKYKRLSHIDSYQRLPNPIVEQCINRWRYIYDSHHFYGGLFHQLEAPHHLAIFKNTIDKNFSRLTQIRSLQDGSYNQIEGEYTDFLDFYKTSKLRTSIRILKLDGTTSVTVNLLNFEMKEENISIGLGEHSQFIVEYRKEQAYICIMNGIELRVDKPAKITNFLLKCDYEGRILDCRNIPKLPCVSTSDSDEIYLKNMGLGIYDGKLYACYGLKFTPIRINTLIEDPVKQISYITLDKIGDQKDPAKEGVWKEIRVKHDKKPKILRSNVSVCIFNIGEVHYILIAGGEVPYKNLKDDFFDIYNILEVYKAVDYPLSNEFDYILLSKEKLLNTDHITYYPLIHSYTFFKDNKVYILGGRNIKGSVSEWTFHLYVLTVNGKPDDWQFIDGQILHNTSKIPKNEFKKF